MMLTLRQLKEKYSGQAIPEWELVANGLKDAPTAPEPEAPKRRGRPPKAETVEEAEPEGE